MAYERHGAPIGNKEARVAPETRLHNTSKYLSPEKVRKEIETGTVTYVELENVDQLDMRLIHALKRLKQKGKPLYVNVNGVKYGNDVLTNQRIDHFISHLEIVDCVVATPADAPEEFSLKSDPLSLQSNTHFINGGLDLITRERVVRQESPYKSRVVDTPITQEKYTPQEALQKTIEDYQRQGLRVAIMAGVYDVLHPGHIEFIEKASQQADVLIVLTNSNYSVSLQPKNNKGDRPVHPLTERIDTLAELDMVTNISAFDSQNILPILAQLHGITYIKSSKDATSSNAGVQAEMDLVEQHGGQNIIIPSIKHDLRPNWMSSSGVIEAVRNGVPDETWLQKEFGEQPASVQRKIHEINATIDSWNTKTHLLETWRNLLKESYSLPLHEAVARERQVIEDMANNFSTIAAEHPDARDYLSYIIPMIIGKKLGLDIRWAPIQYNIPGNAYEVMNVAKLPDGTLEFFDIRTNTFHDPFVFEDYYWRPLPMQYNFITREGTTPFAKRLYAYTKDQHANALSLKVLLEEATYAHTPEERYAYIQDYTAITRHMWESFMGTPIPLENSLHRRRIPERSVPDTLPEVVAHGGTSVMDLAGGFPENSRASIQAALDEKLDVIEIDIVPTKDNKWIVSHDVRLDISTDSTGLTLDKTQEELTNINLRSESTGTTSEKLMSLEEVLGLISSQTDSTKRTFVKIDIKASNEEAEKTLVSTLQEGPIPLDKIIVTSGVNSVANNIHAIAPTIPFELNTVETINYLMVYRLMDEKIMPPLFLEYVRSYAPTINAQTVSLMQVAMKVWGNNIFHTLVQGIREMGLDTQVWVARSLDDYLLDASMGVTHVMMHDPELIKQVLSYRNAQSGTTKKTQ